MIVSGFVFKVLGSPLRLSKHCSLDYKDRKDRPIVLGNPIKGTFMGTPPKTGNLKNIVGL